MDKITKFVFGFLALIFLIIFTTASRCRAQDNDMFLSNIWTIGNIIVIELRDEQGNCYIRAKNKSANPPPKDKIKKNYNYNDYDGDYGEGYLSKSEQQLALEEQSNPLREATERAKQTKDYNDIAAAFEEAKNPQWWQAKYFNPTIGEINGFSLLALAKDMPNTYGFFIDWFDFLITQPNLKYITAELACFEMYIRKQDPNKIEDAIDYLKYLLNTNWASTESEENNRMFIENAINELSETE